MWARRKARQSLIESYQAHLAYYQEEVKRLSSENAALRSSLAARLGTSFHQPFPPVEKTIPPRRLYSDDGMESVPLEED